MCYCYTASISAWSVNFPDTCPCCGKTADSFILIYGRGATCHYSWEVPCCEECRDHTHGYPKNPLNMLTVLLAFLFYPLFPVFLILYLNYLNKKRKFDQEFVLDGEHTSPNKSFQHLCSYGSNHTFAFSSKEYAVLFCLSNAEKIIEVSPDLKVALEKVVKSYEDKGETYA